MRRAAMAVDVTAVVAFVVIGRASHHHAESWSGFVSTAWPFAAGIAAGWLVTAWVFTGRRTLAAPSTGVAVCVATVTVGMVLRVVAGQGTAVAFVIVALAFLGAVMVGGRLVLARMGAPARTPSP